MRVKDARGILESVPARMQFLKRADLGSGNAHAVVPVP
jgi:hypothetical protein